MELVSLHFHHARLFPSEGMLVVAIINSKLRGADCNPSLCMNLSWSPFWPFFGPEFIHVAKFSWVPWRPFAPPPRLWFGLLGWILWTIFRTACAVEVLPIFANRLSHWVGLWSRGPGRTNKLPGCMLMTLEPLSFNFFFPPVPLPFNGNWLPLCGSLRKFDLYRDKLVMDVGCWALEV